MSRDEIVATTYEVGRRLNDLKYEAGLIDRRTHDTVADHLASATGVLAEVRTVNGLAEPERTQRLRALKTAMPAANSANLVGEDELKWRIRTGIRVSLMLVRIVVRALGQELVNAFARYRGRYDTAVVSPERLVVPGQGRTSRTVDDLALVGWLGDQTM